MEFILIGIIAGALLFVITYYLLKRDRASIKSIKRPDDNQRIPGVIDENKVMALLKEEKKIEAVKYARDTGMLSLLEAKEFVEKIERDKTPRNSADNPFSGVKTKDDVIDAVVKEFLGRENKIAAIKYVVEKRKIGLLEAKNYVESIEEKLK